MPDVQIAQCNDWIALYVGGKKVDEGHSLSTREVVAALGITATSRWFSEHEVEAMGWHFADTWSALPPEGAR